MDKPRSLLWTFLSDRSGLAATEFALVLPVMLAGWLGMAQLSQMSVASTKAMMAAQSVGDLMSQEPSLSGNFTDLVLAASQVLSPLPTTSSVLTVDVVSISFNSSNVPQLGWRCTTGSGGDTTAQMNAAIATATGLGTSGQSVIMVTVTYSYTPTITGGIIGTQTFVQRSFNKPRLALLIPQPC
ncbi:MAG TPA: TadE/TadG family type IV pilus assembly protein [Patescibacteria group bacterium]|nr:TadE/TadG family type IV pilus assembly protein [Patescibacteria group bacterium]